MILTLSINPFSKINFTQIVCANLFKLIYNIIYENVCIWKILYISIVLHHQHGKHKRSLCLMYFLFLTAIRPSLHWTDTAL